MNPIYRFIAATLIASLASMSAALAKDYPLKTNGVSRSYTLSDPQGLYAFIDIKLAASASLPSALATARDAMREFVFAVSSDPDRNPGNWAHIVANIDFAAADGAGIGPGFGIVWTDKMLPIEDTVSLSVREFSRFIRYGGANSDGEQLLAEQCDSNGFTDPAGPSMQFCYAAYADYCKPLLRSKETCRILNNTFFGAIDDSVIDD